MVNILQQQKPGLTAELFGLVWGRRGSQQCWVGSMGTVQEGKHHAVARHWSFSLAHVPPAPAPFAEAEEDLMESLDFFL